MKLAFCLFNYFPYGGLQRDFLRIARLAASRGHEVHVYTLRWEGEREPAFHLHLIKTHAFTNHGQSKAFVKQVTRELKNEQFDLVMGFNKMPHLDIYYAADVCYQSRVRTQRGLLYRLLPRYRHYQALEAAVFLPSANTQIFLISPQQQPEFTHYYATPASRFHLLPPGISKECMAPENASDIRHRVRQQFGLTDHETLLLMVGSGFKTKGVDRALQALSAMPPSQKKQCRLWVIGKDDPTSYQQLASSLMINDQVSFLGARDDVPAFLLAADLLIHPSYHENTGTVILEAMAAGLPVLTLDVCGYAHYVTEADAGCVLASPFAQEKFNALLASMMASPQRSTWHKNALSFTQHADIYNMPAVAVHLIETLGNKRDFVPAT